MPPRSGPNIDEILEAIRAEARARGSTERIGAYSAGAGDGGHSLPRLSTKHVADFLALPLDEFISEAYRQILKRPPDPVGIENYQRAILRSRLTRIEVLGRLWLSAEGRRHSSGIPGLGLAFILATSYRLPVLGPIAAFTARVLKLPAHLQDRGNLESTAIAACALLQR